MKKKFNIQDIHRSVSTVHGVCFRKMDVAVTPVVSTISLSAEESRITSLVSPIFTEEDLRDCVPHLLALFGNKNDRAANHALHVAVNDVPAAKRFLSFFGGFLFSQNEIVCYIVSFHEKIVAGFAIVSGNSFLTSLVNQIAYHLSFFNIDYMQLHYNPGSILIEAAQLFLINLSVHLCGKQSDIFTDINIISSLTYEKKTAASRILLTRKDSDLFTADILLRDEIAMSNHRKVRKLLELPRKNMCLLSNGVKVIGTGAIRPDRESGALVVDIIRQHVWELRHGNRVVFRYNSGNIELAGNSINYAFLRMSVTRIFGITDQTLLDEYCAMIGACSTCGHGGIVVISVGSGEEAARLRSGGFCPSPFRAGPEHVLSMSNIDGAILLSPQLECHGFGVILDGDAIPSADASRGARYNSSARYYNKIKGIYEKTLLVVISDDGMVNFWPELRPVKSRKEIERYIQRLEKAVTGTIDQRRYAVALNWLKENRFYITPGMARAINTCIREFYKNAHDCEKCPHNRGSIDACPSYLKEKFIPHPEMNDSFFYDEPRGLETEIQH